MSFGFFAEPPLAEPAPRDHRTYVLQPARVTCVGCGTKLMGRERVCCGLPACRQASRRQQQNERNRRARRTEPRGRQCKDCLAYDTEVSFENLERCETCAVAYQRHGRCPRCQSLLRSNDKFHAAICYRCEPPRYEIEVLWTADDGRVRRLFRTLARGVVRIAGKDHPVLNNPMTVKGGKLWSKTRT